MGDDSFKSIMLLTVSLFGVWSASAASNARYEASRARMASQEIVSVLERAVEKTKACDAALRSREAPDAP